MSQNLVFTNALDEMVLSLRIMQGRLAETVGPDDAAAVVKREDVSNAWVQRVDQFAEAHGLLPREQQFIDHALSSAWRSRKSPRNRRFCHFLRKILPNAATLLLRTRRRPAVTSQMCLRPVG